MDITDIEYHPTKLSQCCGSPIYMDYDICSFCNDHCGYEEDEQEEDARNKVIEFLEKYGIILFGILLTLLIGLSSYAQTTEQVKIELNKYDIHPSHIEIILSQSVLESGWYKSHWCKEYNNIFGLTKRIKDTRGPQVFEHWTISVRSYYNQIYKRYKGGDYYVFLKELPYAMDPKYISKLQTIQSQLK